MREKIVLDLCGGTGSWSKPYRDAGYDVRVITLPTYDLFETECVGRAIRFFNKTSNITETIDADAVYGILCAPTCTMFSLARTMTEEEKHRASINNRVLPDLPEGYVLPDGWNRQAARRSMTSSKFAEAFFRANR